MKKIPRLPYGSENIPDVILNVLYDIGMRVNGRESYAFNNIIRFPDFEINYPILPWNNHKSEIEEGIFFDEFGQQLSEEMLIPFYNEYSKGFFEGYEKLEGELRKRTSLFSEDSKIVSEAIFNRIRGWSDPGHFSYSCFCDADLEEEIKSEFNIENPHVCTPGDFFERGITRGSVFKTWEIILNNPSPFIWLFEKQEEEKQKILNWKIEEDLNLSALEIAYLIYYLSESGYYKIKNPLLLTWKEFGQKYGKNERNISGSYSDIMKDRETRMQNSRYKKIQKVIDVLQNDYPDAVSARKLAESELKITEMNI